MALIMSIGLSLCRSRDMRSPFIKPKQNNWHILSIFCLVQLVIQIYYFYVLQLI